MGYACPVCGTPQRDAEHLADHLAFTAMLHDDAHGVWLDEHAPGWADEGPAALADRVAPRAEEASYEAVFEDTAHEHDHGPGRPSVDWDGPDGADGQGGAGAPGGQGEPVGPGGPGRGDALDEPTRAALAEAREMTRRMRGDGTERGDGGDESGDDGGDDRPGGGDDRPGDGGDDRPGDGGDDRPGDGGDDRPGDDPDGTAGSDGTADGDADEKA